MCPGSTSDDAARRASREIWDAPASDVDLFAPSLDERDDSEGFGTAFDPRSLWFACFFGGPVAATILFALNARRLGQPKQVVPLALGFLAVTFATLTVGTYVAMTGAGADATADASLGRNVRMGTRIVGLALGGVGYFLQRRRFELYLGEGREPAKALLPCIGVIVLSALVSLVWVSVAAVFFVVA